MGLFSFINRHRAGPGTAAAPGSGTPNPVDPRWNREQVVIVADGDEGQRLESVLSGAGHSVMRHVDKDQVLARLQAVSAKAIVLSTVCISVNGWSMCNRIRKREELREIPLILVGQEKDKTALEQHGRLRTRADQYVCGTTAEHLVNAVADAIAEKKMRVHGG